LLRFMNSVDDVVGPINFGNPSEFTIRELAEVVVELTGSASKIVHRPLPEDDPRQRKPDVSKAQELLNWRPSVPLEDGLAKTIAYFDTLLTAPTSAALAS
jgi:UDP-glucuronate decarboxylase